MKKYFKEIIIISTLLLASIVPRFWLLDTTPGFEDDEGRIADISRSIYLEGAFPLRGPDKYFGPLYIYLTSISFYILGISLFSIRLIPAVFGVLTVASGYLLSRILFDRKTAAVTGLLIASSPWHIAASRVGWGSSIVPFFITIGFFFFFYAIKKKDGRFFVASGFLSGLALNSHPQAVLTYVIMGLYLILTREFRVWIKNKYFWAGIVFIFLANFPLILYNLTNQFDTIHWFLTDTSSHAPFSAGEGFPITRIIVYWIGYAWTFYHSLDGGYIALDFWEVLGGRGMYWVPAFFGLGLLLLIYRSLKRQKPEMFLLIWFTVVSLILPLFSKHRGKSVGGLCSIATNMITPTNTDRICYFSLSHYMDVLYPLPYIVIAYFIVSSTKRFWHGRVIKVGVILIVLGLVGNSILFLYNNYFKLFEETKGFRRWEMKLQELIEYLKDKTSDQDYIVVKSDRLSNAKIRLLMHPTSVINESDFSEQEERLKKEYVFYVRQGEPLLSEFNLTKIIYFHDRPLWYVYDNRPHIQTYYVVGETLRYGCISGCNQSDTPVVRDDLWGWHEKYQKYVCRSDETCLGRWRAYVPESNEFNDSVVQVWCYTDGNRGFNISFDNLSWQTVCNRTEEGFLWDDHRFLVRDYVDIAGILELNVMHTYDNKSSMPYFYGFRICSETKPNECLRMQLIR